MNFKLITHFEKLELSSMLRKPRKNNRPTTHLTPHLKFSNQLVRNDPKMFVTDIGFLLSKTVSFLIEYDFILKVPWGGGANGPMCNVGQKQKCPFSKTDSLADTLFKIFFSDFCLNKMFFFP